MDNPDGTQTPLPFMRVGCPTAQVRVCLQSHGSKVTTDLYGQPPIFQIPENICVYFYAEHGCIYRGEPENFFRLCSEIERQTFFHKSYEALNAGKLCDNYLLESGELIYPDKRPNSWANLNILVNDLENDHSSFFKTPENFKSHIFLKSLIDKLVEKHLGKRISIHLLMCRVDHSVASKRQIGEEIKSLDTFLHSEKVQLP